MCCTLAIGSGAAIKVKRSPGIMPCRWVCRVPQPGPCSYSITGPLFLCKLSHLDLVLLCCPHQHYHYIIIILKPYSITWVDQPSNSQEDKIIPRPLYIFAAIFHNRKESSEYALMTFSHYGWTARCCDWVFKKWCGPAKLVPEQIKKWMGPDPLTPSPVNLSTARTPCDVSVNGKSKIMGL